ncbi:MAG: Glucokinase [Phycisphaerae bacterium]|nr:Glucokinase [Phycisphaerae bacterium]
MSSTGQVGGEVCLGVDVGGSSIKAGLVDRDGKVVASAVMSTPVGPDAAVETIAQMFDALLREGRVARSGVVGVGVGTPGPLSPSKGVIYRCANLEGWIDVSIRDLVSRRLDLPVVFDNDGNLAAFGEYWAGAGGRGGDMIALTLGTGVGCGIIIEGRILHGHFENAAEVGHIIVERDGRPCPCGQRGCLEQYASAAGLTKRVKEALAAGAASRLGDDHGRHLDEITSRSIAEAAREGDALCARLWRDACAYLAIACINLQHVINPATIVLGGGLAEAGDFLLDGVRGAFLHHRWRLADDFPVIRRAVLGYDAGMIGAAGWAWATR